MVNTGICELVGIIGTNGSANITSNYESAGPTGTIRGETGMYELMGIIGNVTATMVLGNMAV